MAPVSVTELFANQPFTTVISGGTGPDSGSEMWTVSSSTPFPTAQTTVSQFHVTDTDTTAASEIILVTNVDPVMNVWTVTRGAEGTTPVAHQAGFTVTQVLTAGWLTGIEGSNLPAPAAGAVLYGNPAADAAWLAGPTASTKEFLTSTGSGGTANTPAWGTIATADVPVLNQNTTGSAATAGLAGNVTGVVGVVNGGTGLASLTTFGIVAGGTASTTHVQQIAVGSQGQVLTSSGAGSLPSWRNAPVDWLNVQTQFGAAGNGQRSLNGAMTSGGSVLSISPDTLFAAGDVGKIVMADGLGGTNIPLSGTISAFTNSSTVTLNTAASASGTAQTVYWGTDDTSAIQAAVTAAGKSGQNDNHYLTGNAQAVFLPWAIYMTSAPVVPTASQSFVFLGDYATIVGASSAIINFSRGPGEGIVEIAGIWFEGCGGHVMENISIHGSAYIHDCNAVLRNPGYSLFYMDDVARADGHITALYQAVFRNILWWLGPGTRSIEAWHMVSTGGAELTDIHFVNLNGPNPPGSTPSGQDSTQYQFYIGCTDTSYSTNISWKDCLAASLYGGYIKIDNVKNVTIDGLNVYNTYVESNPNDLIAFQTNATGGNACHAVSVRNVSVNNALGTGTPPPPYHISFTSACSGILVENCVGGWASNGLTINNGTATSAVYLNNPVSQSGYPIISNKAPDTIVAGAGSVATQTLAVSGSLPTTLASVTQAGGGKILQITGPASGGGEAFAYALAGDTADRFYLSAGGHSLFFGSGSATQDVQLFRSGAGVLSVQPTTNPTSVTLNVTASTAQTSTVPVSQLVCHNSGDLAQTIQISTDTAARFKADSNGKQQWGPGGTAATDTDLYRASAGLLETDGNFTVGGTLTAGAPLAVTSGGSGGTAVTAYALVTGGTSSTTPFQTVSGLGSSGQVLASQGAGALPQWSTNISGTAANVSGTVPTTSGGTGLGSVTAYAVVTGGTSSTTPLQQVSGLGTSGQPLVSQGAGSLPSWAPVSGQFLSTYRYGGTTATFFPVNSTTPAAFGSGTIATQPFTAPPSGNVLVTVNCMITTTGGGVFVAMFLSPHGSATTVSSDIIQYESPSAGFAPQQAFPFMLTGLTPGTSYNYDLLGSATSGQAGTIVAFTQTTSPPALGVTDRGGPVVITVQAV
jgi:hypothetical protein